MQALSQTLTIEQVAPQCGWCPQTVRNRMSTGLPVPKHFKLPRSKRVLWRQVDVDAFLTEAQAQ